MAERTVPTLGIVADLRLEIGDGGRRTRAHLSGGPDDLVLDIDDPATLIRTVPLRGRSLRRPPAGIVELLSGTRLQVRSQGRDLASVRFLLGRRPAVRPTGAGLGLAARQMISTPAARVMAIIVTASLVVLRRRSMRRRSS